jgi:hypothetical protein
LNESNDEDIYYEPIDEELLNFHDDDKDIQWASSIFESQGKYVM